MCASRSSFTAILLSATLSFCLSSLAMAGDIEIKVTKTPVPGVPLKKAESAPITPDAARQPGYGGDTQAVYDTGTLPAERVETIVKEHFDEEPVDGEHGNNEKAERGISSFKVPLDQGTGESMVVPNPFLISSGSVNSLIPDEGWLWTRVIWEGDPIPGGAYVTNLEYRLRIGDAGNPDSFYCGDYEIYLFSGTAERDLLIYDNLGGRTDGGFDDDVEDDSDIYLNWRNTHYFDGEDPGQYWGVWIDDVYAGDYGILNYIEFYVYWEVPLPNLTCFTPSGWDGYIVASSEPGTHTDGPNLLGGATTYIDWAVVCRDAEAPETFYTYLYSDGAYLQGWYTNGLGQDWWTWVADYPHVFDAGPHDLCIHADVFNDIIESDESDNVCCRPFTWQPPTDWGDAPDPPHPTLAASNGARHTIDGPWLGDAPDARDPEPDGQPDAEATGDDNDGNDDEGGVQVPVLMQGAASTIWVEVSDGGTGTGGILEAWIDFDGDGSWEATELIFDGWLPAGVHYINVTTPATAVVGQTFGRFRLSLNGGLAPDGPAPDGEVEDHKIWIEEGLVFKWLQAPNLTETGIDVHATTPFILADDYSCTETGRIAEIWVWGSWQDDYLPAGDPTAVDFTLSFHVDIPADVNPDRYSIPGEILWAREFIAGDFEVDIEASDLLEGWLIPPEEYWFPADTICWLYRFFVPASEAFFQYGTPDNPIVYWLDVQAYPHDPGAFFGWKTSLDRWNDDAVWGSGSEPYPGPWFELRYPPGHPYYTESIDLAFMLANDPSSGVPERDGVEDFGLYENEPNPFERETTIRYSLAEGGRVTLKIFNVMGQVVSTLVDGDQSAGPHSEVWTGVDDQNRQLPAGIYFCRLTVGQRSATQKMLYLK